MKNSANLLLTMMALLGLLHVATAQSVTVNATNYKQTIDMMGGDMERSSIAIQSSVNKNEMIDWGFKDIAFNYCRVQYDKNQEMVEGTKNWSFYTKQVTTMKRVKAVNPNIKFFATMRTDYDGFGNDNNMPDWIVNYNTKKIEINKYGIFLADYLEYMHGQGVTIHTLSITKEWTSFVYASRARKIIAKVISECQNRGIPVPKISDQGFWSISQGINYLNDVAELNTTDLYDSFCSHDYQNEGTTKWKTIVAKATALGKKLYNDEFSTGGGGPSSGVEPAISKPIGVYIEKCIAYEAGLSGEIFFEIWSRGINRETRSIYCPWKGTGRRLRGYYIMKHFANNILDSKYITSSINAMPNVYTMAFRKHNKVVLWVINKSNTRYTSMPITLGPSTIRSTVAATYWTENTPISGSNTTYTASGNRFSPTMEGESMNCYIFNVTENPNNSTVVHIKKRNAQGFAIDGNRGGEDGQNVYLWSGDENNVNQQWNEINRGGGYYSYQKVGTNYCIDGNRGGAQGQNVYLWTCNSVNQNQHWKKVSVGSGAYRLEKRNAPGFSLDGGSGGADGQSIKLYSSSSNSQNLHWVFNYLNTSNKTSLDSTPNEVIVEGSLYPNPVIDRLTIPLGKTSEAKFNIMNSAGQTVMKGAIEYSTNTVDLSGLKSGVYTIQLIEGQQVQTHKIIKH